MDSVLIVDDEDVLTDMIASLVEDLGYCAVTASNGHEAIETLRAMPHPPMLIISDMMMPRMNGTAFAQAIRSDHRYRHVPLIMMSAAGRPAPDGLANEFIHKPFDLDDLELLIQEYANQAPEALHE
jgi:two-component system, chemotaxis family, chemotaxis protein CheY